MPLALFQNIKRIFQSNLTLLKKKTLCIMNHSMFATFVFNHVIKIYLNTELFQLFTIVQFYYKSLIFEELFYRASF